MPYLLDQSKPNQKHFEAISAIPHASMQEKALSDYIASQAEKLGLTWEQDALWNVIVKKPASPGYEAAPPVMLQAHMDMVCVKAPDSSFDFSRDPLSLYIDEKGLLRARGTTLGADDGYGVSYLLAAMEEDFPHPPLEFVFTTQEENGCFGVDYLDASKLHARRMIGLDAMWGNIEYTCCVGCFTSDRMIVRKKCALTDARGQALKLSVSGIQPVREGALVHPEIHNAIKIIARLLYAAYDASQALRLVALKGGEAENYNPVFAEAVLFTDDADAVKRRMEREFSAIRRELDDGRQAMKLAFACEACEKAVAPEDTRALIDLLYLMPSATVQIDVNDNTMTATNNVGVVSLSNGAFTLTMSDRAKNKAHKEGVLKRVEALARLCGATVETTARYASWEYRPDSPLLACVSQLMKETYGHDMIENICPGGLESCSLVPRMPELDVVMFAPIGGKCHSTEEYLSLESFDRVYAFLKTLLGRLKN